MLGTLITTGFLIACGVMVWLGGYIVGRAQERRLQEGRRRFRRTYGLPWR